MLSLLRTLRRFRRETASLAALEFALVLPILLLLLAGVYDFSEAAIVRAEVYNAADVMAASASSVAVQQDGSTALTYQQIQLVESSIWALIPSLRSGLAQAQGSPKSVTMSSVLFYPDPFTNSCTFGSKTPCTYFADVAWSVAYTGGGNSTTFDTNLPNSKDCNQDYVDQSNQVAASASLSGTNNVSFFRTLGVSSSSALFSDTGTDQNEAGTAPILVVNIEYTYTPVFSFYILQPFTFWVDGYWPVRSVKNNVKATTSNLGAGNYTIEPLESQFTTINAASLSAAPSNAYCVNAAVTGSSS
jgi:Flp pilus assembly protein TadG